MSATYIILHYKAKLVKKAIFSLLISWSREQTRQRVIRETIWRLTVFDTSDQAVICTKSTFENIVKNGNSLVHIFVAHLRWIRSRKWKRARYSAVYSHTMATALVVGDRFRNKVTQLLEKTDSALPPRLRDELKETLEKSEPTTLSFSTARKLKQHLQGEGEALMVPESGWSEMSNPCFWWFQGILSTYTNYWRTAHCTCPRL